MVKKCWNYPKLKKGERVMVPSGSGQFLKYLPNGRVEIHRFGGIKEIHKAKDVEPSFRVLSKRKVRKCFKLK